MTLVIREYQEGQRDWRLLCQGLEQLQEHLVGMDQLGLLKLEPGFAERQAREVRNLISAYNGRVFIAEVDGGFAGIITGYTVPHAAINPFGSTCTQFGIIGDVFVVQEHRRKGIGSQLMQTLENYLHTKGCEVTYLTVNAANSEALEFYKLFGYSPMEARLVKVL